MEAVNSKLWDLKYWSTGEYQVIQERLRDKSKEGIAICPLNKADVFRSLKETSYDQCKVAIFGQDPYPNPLHATGIAFNIPSDIPKDKLPPTLKNIFREYKDDLHYPEPTNGSLLPWCKQGILLYNVIPTCTAYTPNSHHNWWEYHLLVEEIISKLNEKSVGQIVFVFLGNSSREFSRRVDSKHPCLYYSHPSPLGVLRATKNNFLGSRMFTKVNSVLDQPVDWRLPDGHKQLPT